MADTIPNVSVGSNVWVDVYAAASIAVGQQITVENVGVADVYLTVAATEPAVGSTSYNIIKRDGPQLVNNVGDLGVWAYCPNDGGSLNVSTTGGFSAATQAGDTFELPLDTYGSVATTELIPLVQTTAQYGVNAEIMECLEFLGGTCTEVDSNYVIGSGTSANGFGALLTVRQLIHKGMQGLVTRIPAIFDTPVVDNTQFAGLTINTDNLGFGYQGTVFGIFYGHGGKTDIQVLTVTTFAAGNENATVTINGVPFTVPLTNGTVEHNAFEIAVSLNAQVGIESSFSSNGATVVSRSLRAISHTLYSFSSSTAVAAWVKQFDGLAITQDFIPQTSWNVDTKPSLDPQTGNTFDIRFQYGYGVATFRVLNSATGNFETVHIISNSNIGLTPLVTQPTLRCGWVSINTGNTTTNVEVKGASLGVFREGGEELAIGARSLSLTTPNVAPGALTNLIVLRNRIVFGDKRNRGEAIGIRLQASTDSNKGAIIEIVRSAVVAGDLIFSYVDEQNSIIEVATDHGESTGGNVIDTIIAPATGDTIDVDLKLLSKALSPGEEISLRSEIQSGGAAANVTITVTYQEDL